MDKGKRGAPAPHGAHKLTKMTSKLTDEMTQTTTKKC